MSYLRSEMKYMESLHEYAEYRGLEAWEYDRDYAVLLQEAKQFATMEEWANYAERTQIFQHLEEEGIYLSTFHGAKLNGCLG